MTEKDILLVRLEKNIVHFFSLSSSEIFTHNEGIVLKWGEAERERSGAG